MKHAALLVPVFVCCFTIAAQQRHAVVFTSYNAVGLVAGKLPLDFTAQTENGIEFKNWFVGAGFGFDNYYRATFSLFGAIKKTFPVKHNSLFLYANAGKNLIAKDRSINNSFSTSYTKGGFYGDAGAGYKIKTTKKTAVFFCVGNSFKNIREIEETHGPFGMPGVYDGQRKFARVSFKLGFQF